MWHTCIHLLCPVHIVYSFRCVQLTYVLSVFIHFVDLDAPTEHESTKVIYTECVSVETAGHSIISLFIASLCNCQYVVCGLWIIEAKLMDESLVICKDSAVWIEWNSIPVAVELGCVHSLL